jgi:hypothetical protein
MDIARTVEMPEMLAVIDAGVRSLETGSGVLLDKHVDGLRDGLQSNPFSPRVR